MPKRGIKDYSKKTATNYKTTFFPFIWISPRMLHRDYSQLAYEDLSLDLKFVASRYASGSSDAVPHMRDALGVGKSGWRREKERGLACGCSCDTAVAYREKLPYHANPGMDRNTSGSERWSPATSTKADRA